MAQASNFFRLLFFIEFTRLDNHSIGKLSRRLSRVAARKGRILQWGGTAEKDDRAEEG